jgi:hypothetical protein
MSDIFKIRPGQRYLFYAQTPHKKDNVAFIAQFLGINSNSFQCNNVECKEKRSYNNCGILSMPLGWITKVETLDYNETLLSSDVLLE